MSQQKLLIEWSIHTAMMLYQANSMPFASPRLQSCYTKLLRMLYTSSIKNPKIFTELWKEIDTRKINMAHMSFMFHKGLLSLFERWTIASTDPKNESVWQVLSQIVAQVDEACVDSTEKHEEIMQVHHAFWKRFIQLQVCSEKESALIATYRKKHSVNGPLMNMVLELYARHYPKPVESRSLLPIPSRLVVPQIVNNGGKHDDKLQRPFTTTETDWRSNAISQGLNKNLPMQVKSASSAGITSTNNGPLRMLSHQTAKTHRLMPMTSHQHRP